MTSPSTANPSSCPALDEVVRKVDEISTLPHIALRTIEVAASSDSSAADLKCVMENDAALSSRVLRCVNSSAYAVRTAINNLQQAIAYLGLKQIRNLAMTAAVSELFRDSTTIGPYSRSGLWRHVVSVGITARLIAMRRNMPDFEDIYLAGLLHDVGIILEDQYCHSRFCGVLGSLQSERTLCQTERTHLGFDHAQFGREVAKLWGFPEAVQASIAHHHAVAIYRGPFIDQVRCVEVANLICTLKGIPSIGLKLVKTSLPSINQLGFSREDLAILAEDLDHELARNTQMFRL